jgi:hypothetical protein
VLKHCALRARDRSRSQCRPYQYAQELARQNYFRFARHPPRGIFQSDTASTAGRAHFLSSAGQFVSKVMEVDLVWSAVWTTNCLPLGLTSKLIPVKFGRSS